VVQDIDGPPQVKMGDLDPCLVEAYALTRQFQYQLCKLGF